VFCSKRAVFDFAGEKEQKIKRRDARVNSLAFETTSSLFVPFSSALMQREYLFFSRKFAISSFFILRSGNASRIANERKFCILLVLIKHSFFDQHVH